MNEHYQQLRAAFESAGQGQVFRFWDTLSETQRSGLLEDAAAVDLAEVNGLCARFLGGSTTQTQNYDGLVGAPFIPVPEHGGDAARWEEARKVGEQALHDGRVACFTVAGGQGTRLGYDGPKGAYVVTPLRKKSLFQVFAEKILAARRRTGAAIPWFIMTSRVNHDRTEDFFRKNDWFGLGKDSVFLFPQGLMPAVDKNGKILLESPGHIALLPDGHGGSLRALVRSGATQRMRREGIDLLSYFQVDNPLIHCVDPAFIGFHLLGASEMSSKALLKTDPAEKVGHFCLRDGRMCVVEYSDLPEKLAQQRDKDGQLTFRAGSIAIHILSVDLVERMGGRNEHCLPFHRADKKIQTVDDNGCIVKPEKPNGVKFEMFVFDAIEQARNPVVIETLRREEFSAVKNATGVDSPDTCREAQLLLAVDWLKQAGCKVPVDARGLPLHPIEISPLFADSAQALMVKKDLLRSLDFSKPLYLGV